MALVPAARLAARGLGATAFATVAGVGAWGYTDPGVSRQLIFWRRAFPIWAHYRLTQLRFMAGNPDRYDAETLALHERYADDALGIVLGLRGLYVKIGQVASMRDDMMHESYLRRFRTLQYQVPAYPLAHVTALIEAELGQPTSEIFASIEPEPLGAASIGQVHAAVLAPAHGGREVVVKVQYPEVEQQFDWDMRTIRLFCNLAMPEHIPFLDEIERQFATEFDYRDEAKNLAEVRSNVMPVWGHRVCIPAPLQELCTKRVLVMERISGTTITDAIREYLRQTAAAEGRTLAEVEGVARAEMRAGRAGGVAAGLAETGRALYWRDLLQNARRSAWNWSLGLVPGLGGQQALVWSAGGLDIGGLIDTVWECHAQQLLVDGCFNADPHPGNIMIMEDGRIGLVDFGQVKRISARTRHIIARMVVALAEDDRPAIVSLIQEGGMQTRRNDPWVLEMHARLAWDSHDRELVCGGLDVQSFAASLDRIDPVIQADDEMVMPVRMGLMLMGLSYALGLNTKIYAQLERTARAVLTNEPAPSDDVALATS